jgi:hypothetical protein
MKKFIPAIIIIISLFFCGVCFAVNFKTETGFNYDWWESNNGDKGSQTYVPLRFWTDYKNFSFQMLSAFAYSKTEPSGAQDHSLSCVVDTKLNFSYTVLDKLPFAVLMGLDFNIPTGKTDLKEKKLGVIMDPDLVSITHFGEGFNINPTISIVKEWEMWAAGIGIGYLWRGEYDYSTATKDYDPGDIFSLTGEVVYDFTQNWSLKLFGEYAYYGTDEVDDHNYYQEGDFLLMGIGLEHYQTDWNVSITLKTIIRFKSEFQEAGLGLVKEDKKSYGDEWIADISCRYHLNKKTTLKSLAQLLWIEENDYSSSSPLFIGNRKKISCGIGLVRQLTEYLTGELNINGFYMDDERNWYQDSDRTYKGFSSQLRLTCNF